MKKRVTKIEFVDEPNDTAKVWIERLIERLLLEELDLPVKIQAIALRGTLKK